MPPRCASALLGRALFAEGVRAPLLAGGRHCLQGAQAAPVPSLVRSCASAAGAGSGARRSAHSRSARARTKSRHRSSLLDLLAHLKDASIELNKEGPLGPQWANDKPRWQYGEGSQQRPASLLPMTVDESCVITDPDLYEVELFTNRKGQQVVKVVHVDGSDASDGEDDESPLDQPFLPFGVHR